MKISDKLTMVSKVFWLSDLFIYNLCIFFTMKFIDCIEPWKDVLLRPSDFYREMPKTGGYIDPVRFATVNLSISMLFYLFFNSEADVLIDGFSKAPMVFTIVIFTVGIGALFIEATILYIIYKAIGGTGTYEGTARFVLYASAAPMFLWVPLVGWIFGIYQFYLYLVGGKFVHNMSMERSALAIMLLISLGFASGILLGILIKA
jgi:hypothetical protein